MRPNPLFDLLCRPVARWSAAVLAASTLIWAAPALAATVELKDGTKLQVERYYPTYTALVLLTSDFDMRLIPNDQVKSIDGVPFSQVYWADKESRQPPELAHPATTLSPSPAASSAPAVRPAQPAGAPQSLLPLEKGAFRAYRLTQSRTTWLRVGRTMRRLHSENESGLDRETIVGAASAHGAAAISETIVLRGGHEPSREEQVVSVIEPRSDGYYLLAQSVLDPLLRQPHQETRIRIPPRIWPSSLEVGTNWTVGPFYRLGAFEAGRMEVIGRENVTVPAGTYPGAYKVRGFSHVFAGSQELKNGRLVTNNGTLETTTWMVPGLGPVKEEAKMHLHQDFFPADPRKHQMPLVVECRTTRALSEFSLGAS